MPPAGYFSVADGTYALKLDLANLPDSRGETGQIDISVNYTSDDVWSIVVFIAGMGCDASDPRAPERIHVRVARDGSFWTGKAMFYNGRWKTDNSSCSVAESDEASVNFYTDFVANDTAARASVYMMSRSKTDLSDIEDFGMDSFGINFSSQDDTTAYANPFCNPSATLDALWENDCAAIDAAVSAQAYGPATDWIVPSEFYQMEITLPTSL